MKDDEFKKKLSEVAEWRIPDHNEVNKVSGPPRRYKTRKPAVEVIEEQDDCEEPVTVENPNFAIQLVKAKIQPVTCEDCGRHCEHGRQKDLRFYFNNGATAIRERCVTCQKHKNPSTGQFDLSSAGSNAVWHNYLRTIGDRKSGSKTDPTVIQHKIYEEGRTVDYTENDQEIIKKYLD